MTRLEAFISFEKCPMRAKMIKKITEAQYIECVGFIEENDSLEPWAFEQKLNRWKMGEEKPKQFTYMWSLILEANSKSKVVKNGC